MTAWMDAVPTSIVFVSACLTLDMALGSSELAEHLKLEMRDPRPLSLAEEGALRPGDLFKECASCPEMIVVPAGEFFMPLRG